MKCDRARAEVPPGAWIIRHPDDDPEHVHVAVYDERRPGSILVIGQFKIATGVFVRVVVNSVSVCIGHTDTITNESEDARAPSDSSRACPWWESKSNADADSWGVAAAGFLGTFDWTRPV